MLNYRDYMPKTSDQKRDLFLRLVTGTDVVCDAFLDEEYREVCRELAAELVRKGRLILRGRIRSWITGIVHVAGWVNFLDDPSQPCHMTSAELAESCGVGHSTMMDKSRQIRKLLRIVPLDPRWCRIDMLLENPLVWMIEINGVIVDARTASRELQVAAFDQGVIPFIPPDDWQQQQAKEQVPEKEPDSKTSKKKMPKPNGTLSLFDQTADPSDD